MRAGTARFVVLYSANAKSRRLTAAGENENIVLETELVALGKRICALDSALLEIYRIYTGLLLVEAANVAHRLLNPSKLERAHRRGG